MHALDFPDDTFDVVHAHQVLQHVGDPVAALREMRRVTRPGGVVAVRDSDYAAFTWFPQLPELDEWLDLYQRVARGNGGEPDAGRRLLVLGARGRLHRRDRDVEHLVLRRPRGPRLVGRHVGGPDPQVRHGPARHCATGAATQRRPAADLGRLAGLGRRPGRLAVASCTAS